MGGKPAGENMGRVRATEDSCIVLSAMALGTSPETVPRGKPRPRQGALALYTVSNRPSEMSGGDDTEFESLQEGSYASVISATGRALGPLYFVTLMVSGSPFEALIDPGSSASI